MILLSRQSLYSDGVSVSGGQPNGQFDSTCHHIGGNLWQSPVNSIDQWEGKILTKQGRAIG